MAKTVEELQAEVAASSEYIAELARVLRPLADEYKATGGVVDQAKALMALLRAKRSTDPNEAVAELVTANRQIAKLEEWKAKAIDRLKVLSQKVHDLGGEL